MSTLSERSSPTLSDGAKLTIVVLISGNGSNLQAIIEAIRRQALPVTIGAVISNQAQAPGLRLARASGLTTEVVDHCQYADRAAFDQALRERVDAYRPGLVVLAGFMRILGDSFVGHFRGRMLNIHPSLLPRHAGRNTHARALRAGDTMHGASVHFVTEDLDGGPLVVQARVAVLRDDSAERLAARVLEQEHRILPLAIRWFADGRLRLGESAAILDGVQLHQPYLFSGDGEALESCP